MKKKIRTYANKQYVQSHKKPLRKIAKWPQELSDLINFDEYPHLQKVTRDNGVVHFEVEELLLKLIDAERAKAAKTISKVENSLVKAHKLVRALGTAIEKQVNLTPFTVDTAQNTQYRVVFSYHHIRVLLSRYWEVVADDVEATISNDEKAK